MRKSVIFGIAVAVGVLLLSIRHIGSADNCIKEDDIPGMIARGELAGIGPQANNQEDRIVPKEDPAQKGAALKPFVGLPNKKPGSSKKQFRIFLTTYKQGDLLYHALDSVFKAMEGKYSYEVYIINNYGVLGLPEKYANKVTGVIDNLVRPDFSTGHLPRDWNTCLLYGFQNLKEPVSDIVVCMHGDINLLDGWADYVYDLHMKKHRCFTSFGVGDVFCSYTAEGVRKIGMWDERFCNIGIQEKDYFLRAALWAKDCATVNDRKSVVHNPEENKVIFHPNLRGITRGDPEHHRSISFHPWSRGVFKAKWGFDMHALRGPQGVANGTVVPGIPVVHSWLTYPYFEQDIYDLYNKGYVLPKGKNIYDVKNKDIDDEDEDEEGGADDEKE